MIDKGVNQKILGIPNKLFFKGTNDVYRQAESIFSPHHFDRKTNKYLPIGLISCLPGRQYVGNMGEKNSDTKEAPSKGTPPPIKNRRPFEYAV